MAAGIYVDGSGTVTIACEGGSDPLVTDVEHLFTHDGQPVSAETDKALRNRPVSLSFMSQSAAEYLGVVDLFKQGTYVSRTLLPTWAATLSMVESDPSLDSWVVAVHVDGSWVELCLLECDYEVVEVLDMVRLEVDTDEALFVSRVSNWIGKVLFPRYHTVHHVSISAKDRIDIVVSAPTGPSDALMNAVRSTLPSSGLTIAEHRLNAADLAHGALVMSKMLSGKNLNTLLLPATWWSFGLLCGGKQETMIDEYTTMPMSFGEVFGKAGSPPMPSALVLKGINGKTIEFPLPATGMVSAKIAVDIGFGCETTIKYENLAEGASNNTIKLSVEDLLRANVRARTPRVTNRVASRWELDAPTPLQKRAAHDSGSAGVLAGAGFYRKSVQTSYGVGQGASAQASEAISKEAIVLRDALVRALSQSGIGLFSDPRRLQSYVSDIAREDTPELRVLCMNVDEELMAPVAAAVATGQMDELKRARNQVYLLLVEDRIIVENVARNVAWALTAAAAWALGSGLG